MLNFSQRISFAKSMGFVQSEYLSFDPLERAFVLCFVQCLASCVGAIRSLHQSTVDLTVWCTNVGHKGAVLTPQESSGPISSVGKIFTMLGCVRQAYKQVLVFTWN